MSLKSKKITVLIIITVLMTAFVLAGCEKNEGNDSSFDSLNKPSAAEESSIIELPADVPEEKPVGTVKGADVFVYSDEWELPLGYTTVVSKDGDTTKQFSAGSKGNIIDESDMGNYSRSAEYNANTYQYFLSVNAAKPDMRKITSREFAGILSSMEFSEDIMQSVAKDDFEWNYDGYNESIADDKLSEMVYRAVQDIQYFPDGYEGGASYNSIPPENLIPMYYYWQDSNERSKRRIELSINYKAMVLTRTEYDEYGDVDSRQVLYSYPYELEKAALEKYGCSKEREQCRLSDPYAKVICSLPSPPDSGKELKGEAVLVPDEVAASPSTKKRVSYFDALQKKYEESVSGTDCLEDGTLEYQEQMALGKAYPNMRKITADEVVQIFDKAKIYEGFDYENIENSHAWVENNLKEIKKIQYFADVNNNTYIGDSYWLYWPDADTVDKRIQEIQIFSDGIVRVAEYNKNGNRVSLEDVFDLQKKIHKMQDEGISFDEYPLKRKVTPEEVKAIFESAETDPNADYKDSKVCTEWTLKRIEEIAKIQPFPDWKTENKNDTLFYCYWPDSDSIGDRKSEIQINCETGTAILYIHGDHNTIERTETLFDLRKITKQQQKLNGN